MRKHPKWLQNILDNIPCTKEQAQQIKDRNKPLLKILENLPKEINISIYETIYINCPHCVPFYTCEEHKCAWYKWKGKTGCAYIPFKDITLYQITHIGNIRIEYGWNWARLIVNKSVFTNKQQFQQELKNAKRFLRGHIQWANTVLNWKDNNSKIRGAI